MAFQPTANWLDIQQLEDQIRLQDQKIEALIKTNQALETRLRRLEEWKSLHMDYTHGPDILESEMGVDY